MDNNDAWIKLVECGLFIKACTNVRMKVVTKFRRLEDRLAIKRETTFSLYSEIDALYKELGL